MKTETISGISNAEKVKPQSRSVKEGNGFAGILDKEIEGRSCSPAVSQNLLPANTVDPVAALSHLPISLYGAGDEVQLDMAAEKALNELENVSLALQKPGANLREIYGMFSDVASEVEKLRANASNLPVGHPLRRISEELAVLVRVESIKWQRGDYSA